MPNLGPLEIGLIVLVILLLFGATRLPKLGRSMGQSIKGFKQGLNEEVPSTTTRRQRRRSRRPRATSRPTPESRRRPALHPSRDSRHTAVAEMPSPRPSHPMPSLVVPLSADGRGIHAQHGRQPLAHRLPVGREPRPLADHHQVHVLAPPSRPAASRSTTCRSSSMLATPAKASSVSGKSSPMSPRPAAPRRASMRACTATSASECPARPCGWSTSTPQSTSRRPSAKRCAS